MYGNLKFNGLFGGIGFIITFLVSFSNNFITTSLIRSGAAFVIWFLLAFIIRWMLALPGTVPSQKVSDEAASEEEYKGSLVDLTTPDEMEEMADLLKAADRKAEGAPQETEFEPLNPPRLVTAKSRSTEEMVKAVRHLTEE